jgi:hypothetical protein
VIEKIRFQVNVRDNSISSNEGTVNQLGNLMNRVIDRADHSNDQRIYKQKIQEKTKEFKSLNKLASYIKSD